VIRRTAGAGSPSAATAAAAAAAARAARSGGSGPGAASALFAARGPATDGRGTPPVEDDAPTGGRSGVRPEDLPDGSLLGPDSPTTGNEPAGADLPGSAGDDRADDLPPDLAPDLPADASEAPAAPVPSVPAPAEPLSGEVPAASVERAGTPIFDTVSMWFTTDSASGQTERVIDLRDRPADDGTRAPSQRWSALGDQRWLATNARAAAGPEVAGTTEVGLPRRRPGANLIPSAASAVTSPAARPESHRRAPAVAGARGEGPGRVDADAVRGRLSSYQRGLTSARRARHLPADRPDGGLYGGAGADNDSGRSSGDEGG